MIIKIKIEAPQDENSYEIFANAGTFQFLKSLILKPKHTRQKDPIENLIKKTLGFNFNIAEIGVGYIEKVLKSKHVAWEFGKHRYSLTLIDGVKDRRVSTEEHPHYRVH